MSVLVLVTKPEDAEALTHWGVRFAKSHHATLSVLCWGFSPTVEFPLLADQEKLHAIATIEDDTGDEAIEVGQRMLNQIMREAAVEQDRQIIRRVFLTDETFRDVALEAEQHDLILLAINHQATVAIIKRAPPLTRLWGERVPNWIPRLNPADYADLVLGLRRGSQFRTDFMIMLGLAAAIASLGLIQDSPAVVIGSMLLAPLMTPMIGSGLALAQANAKLAKTCFRSISAGFVLTLLISTADGRTETPDRTGATATRRLPSAQVG